MYWAYRVVQLTCIQVQSQYATPLAEPCMGSGHNAWHTPLCAGAAVFRVVDRARQPEYCRQVGPQHGNAAQPWPPMCCCAFCKHLLGSGQMGYRSSASLQCCGSGFEIFAHVTGCTQPRLRLIAAHRCAEADREDEDERGHHAQRQLAPEAEPAQPPQRIAGGLQVPPRLRHDQGAESVTPGR